MLVRIATDKTQDGVSFIEVDEAGVLWLKSKGDYGDVGLPCCIDDVKAFFANIGREFDITKLPKNVVLYPY